MAHVRQDTLLAYGSFGSISAFVYVQIQAVLA